MSSASGRLRRRVRLLAGVLPVAVAAALLGGAGPAHAEEVYPRPADGVIDLRGHGYGHGNGMSQYGAYGGALAGRTWDQIIAFYYPGTSLGTIGNPTIRVRVASLGAAVQALPQTGLSLSWDGSKPVALRTVVKAGEPEVARWRLLRDPGSTTKVRVEYLTTGSTTWQHFTTSPGQLAMFVNPGLGMVTTLRGSTEVVYRGELRAARTAADTLHPIVALPMESYLRSVVPGEMPASWDPDAVSAQAVAARSFAEYHRRYAPISSAWYDVYDDTRSQVFHGTRVGGTSYEYASSDAAVSATAGRAAFYGSSIAFTQFSSSSGGWTANGGKPYLIEKQDPWDAVSANPNHTWTAGVKVSTLESRYPQIGSYQRMRITERTGKGDMGGRVVRAVLEGSAGSVSVTGNTLRSQFGLKSNWFVPTDPKSWPAYPRDVTGDSRLDVLAVESSTGALRVYPATGTGGWKPTLRPESSGWDAWAKVFTAGTWDGDAISDVMVQDASGDLYLRRGLGNGTFASPVLVGRGWHTLNLVFPVGDFDGDGINDLMARRALDGALLLYTGTGLGGGFTGARVIGTGWQIFDAVLSPGDFTGDGTIDVLARTPNGDFYLYPGNGSGGWKARQQIGRGWQIFDALTALGDYTGDGRNDVLARTRDGLLYVYPGNGSGNWQPRRQVGLGWQIFSHILQ